MERAEGAISSRQLSERYTTYVDTIPTTDIIYARRRREESKAFPRYACKTIWADLASLFYEPPTDWRVSSLGTQCLSVGGDDSFFSPAGGKNFSGAARTCVSARRFMEAHGETIFALTCGWAVFEGAVNIVPALHLRFEKC